MNQKPSDSIREKIELLCDEFDEAWADQRQPALPEFLNRVAPSDQDLLLEYLIPIDVEYRRRNNEPITANFYFRFGSFAEKIATEVFQADTGGAVLSGSTGSQDSPRPVDRLPVVPGYEIIRRIGQGGMGTVYLAEQSEPFKRKVAIKVVKSGHDSRDIIARFEAERQALAMMDHPNIARILEAGSTEAGFPYFTMEWVQGQTIVEYCDSKQLNIRERIKLFVKVCVAVQHAHQKGIIHRDLKPSNILVAEVGGEPTPKVIDFGLAKALGKKARLNIDTALTFFGTIIGTPQYMSPEQAETDSKDVDTRTDIYSLGVVLFELLTGATPLRVDEVRKQHPLRLLELIQQMDAPRPSSRLGLDPKNDMKVVSLRKTSLVRLRSILRGELDWVVLKSLHREPKRRYQTVNSFQKDLERFLDNDPVQARPPSSWYSFLKLAQKHKFLLGTAATFALLLIASFLLITKFYLDENAARIETEKKIARAHYLSAIGYFSRNRTTEATEALSKIKPEYRHIEYRLKREQFRGNCFTLPNHEMAHPYMASLSPDGKWIASANAEKVGILDIWNSESETIHWQVGELVDDDYVRSIAFHPEQNLVAMGLLDKVQLWDLETGEKIRTIEKPGGPIVSLDFTDEGKSLAIAGGYLPTSKSKDKNFDIEIHQLNGDEAPLRLMGHTDCVSDVRFHPNGKHLLSSSWDKTIRLWDIRSGKEIDNAWIGAYVMSTDFHPSGEKIACGTANNRLILFGIEGTEFKEIWRRNAYDYEGDTVECLAFSPDGEKIATGGFDRTAKIWEVQSGDEKETLRGHFAPVVNVDFGPDSNKLLTASQDGIAKFWDLERSSESRILKRHLQSVNAISFSPDSRWLVSAGGNHPMDQGFQAPTNSRGREQDFSIRLWNLKNWKEELRFEAHQDSVSDIEFNPNSKSEIDFVSTGMDGDIYFWNQAKVAPLKRISKAHDGKAVHAIAFHPNGNSFVTVGDDQVVRFWDTESKSNTRKLKLKHLVRQVAWNHQGTRLAIIALAEKKTFVRVFDMNDKELFDPIPVQKDTISLAFSFDDSQLAIGNSELRIFDSETGKLNKRQSHNRLGLYALSYYSMPGVPRLLTGGREGAIRLWDSETWEELAVFEVKGISPWNFVYDCQFSPDGRMIATGNRDGTIRIWNAYSEGSEK